MNVVRRQIENENIEKLEEELQDFDLHHNCSIREGEFWATVTIETECDHSIELVDELIEGIQA